MVHMANMGTRYDVKRGNLIPIKIRLLYVNIIKVYIVYLLSLDNLETRHFVTTIAMRGKYDLLYYPGMEDLIDNLHIDLKKTSTRSGN